jgi:hypothetical protein
MPDAPTTTCRRRHGDNDQAAAPWESRRLRDALSAVVAGVLLFGAPGCKTVARQERATDSRIQDQKDIAASNEQIRLRMRSLVGPLCGEIEQAADRIIAESRDHSVQRAALIWKIEAVPALREALFQPDPHTAAGDTWVLAFQMADYFEKGPGSVSLGAESPHAVAACRHLEEEIATVVAAMTHSGDVSKARAFVEKWAADHPIRGSIAGRESTLTRALENAAGDPLSAGQAVAELSDTIDDLNRRIEIYSDQLFRQARWEAQLLQSNLADDLKLDTARPLAERALASADKGISTLDELAPLLERAVSTAADAPDLIAKERIAALTDLGNELTRTMTFVQDQRIGVLQQLTRERIAALQDLHADLRAERQALTGDLEKVSLRVVDHAFLRVAQLLAAMVAAAFIGLLVFVRLWKRAPRLAAAIER